MAEGLGRQRISSCHEISDRRRIVSAFRWRQRGFEHVRLNALDDGCKFLRELNQRPKVHAAAPRGCFEISAERKHAKIERRRNLLQENCGYVLSFLEKRPLLSAHTRAPRGALLRESSLLPLAADKQPESLEGGGCGFSVVSHVGP